VISKKSREKTNTTFLQTLSNRIPALITVYDIRTGVYLYVNDAIKTLLDYTPDEFLKGGISFVSSLVHPDDLTRVFEENDAAVKAANKNTRSTKKDEFSVTFEYRLLHKNGTYRWMHTDGVVFSRNTLGKVAQVMNVSVDITEHKDGETALLLRQKQAEERYRMLFSEASDAIFILSTDGTILEVNEKALEVFKWSKKQLLDRFLGDFVHPSEKDELVFKTRKKELYAFKTLRTERRMRRKDGKFIMVEGTGKLLPDGRILCIFRDISQRKKMEDLLRGSEARYKGLFETATSAMQEEDLTAVKSLLDELRKKGVKNIREHLLQHPEFVKKAAKRIKILDVNPANLKLFKASNKTELIKSFSKTFLPETYTFFVNKFIAYVQEEKDFREETIQQTLDGEPRNLLVSMTLPSKLSQINTVLVSRTDITDRKNIENNILFLSEISKLLSSSLDYKTTLESVTRLAVPRIADWCSVEMLEDGSLKTVALAHKDPSKITWAREFRKRNPLDMAAAQGAPNVIRTSKPEFYSDITDAMLAAAAKNNEELHLFRSLGLRSIIIVPIIIHGKPIGVIQLVTSESRRHYNPSDLAMAEELASRTAVAIENATLYAESQKAVSLRDDFLSIASHELKTPITSLKVYLQILERRLAVSGDTDLKEYLSKIDRQVNKMTGLIKDLLDVTKIQSGQLVFTMEKFSLKELVAEIVEMTAQTTKKHTFSIKGTDGKKVFGDRDRLGQVITNLLTNATKYSPRSEKIIVRIKPEKEVISLRVQDFGIGIEKKHQSKIFDRFYRVSDLSEKTFPGLGIGLFISNQIILRHGGTMNVKSEKGKGSIFAFRIPYKTTASL